MKEENKKLIKDLLDAIFIAAVIGQSKVLASSLRVFQGFDEKGEEKSMD